MLPNYKISTRCYYCSQKFRWTLSRNTERSKEHIIPKAVMGFNDPNNYVAACSYCNQLKGRMTLPNFAQWLTIHRNDPAYYNSSMFGHMAKRAWKLYNKTSWLHKKYNVVVKKAP